MIDHSDVYFFRLHFSCIVFYHKLLEHGSFSNKNVWLIFKELCRSILNSNASTSEFYVSHRDWLFRKNMTFLFLAVKFFQPLLHSTTFAPATWCSFQKKMLQENHSNVSLQHIRVTGRYTMQRRHIKRCKIQELCRNYIQLGTFGYTKELWHTDTSKA